MEFSILVLATVYVVFRCFESVALILDVLLNVDTHKAYKKNYKLNNEALELEIKEKERVTYECNH